MVAKDYKFMCSSLGQQMIEDDIKEQGLTGVVVGACSPHLHEKTFRAACKRAGLNPYLCQMTNLREHVSWVNADKAAGTMKAKSLISAAAERVKHQKPLEPMKVKVNPATLVVGGGIAGLQATLELADAGYHVYLVEREPSIGGHMAQFDKTFPTLDCSACILTPKMSEVGQHENVTMLDLLRVGGGERLGGQFQGEGPQEGPLRRLRQMHRLRHLHRKVPEEGDRRRVRGRHGQPQGDLHALPAGRAADARDRHRQLHLVHQGQVPGLLEGLPHRGRGLRPEGRNRRTGGGQHHHGHRLEAVRLQADSAVRLRPAAERLHEPRVRAALQRRRTDQRQDRAARRQDRAETHRHRPLRRQPRRGHQPLLLLGLLHGGVEVRPPACWKRPRPRSTRSTSTCGRR